jgi:outer membrane protein insertion porin family
MAYTFIPYLIRLFPFWIHRLSALSAICLAIFFFEPAFSNDLEEDYQNLLPHHGKIITAIKLAGNHITRDHIIAREIWSETGRPMDTTTVRQDVVRLENLAIFGYVAVIANPDGEGVALNYEFTEMPIFIPFPAVSYTEENGFSLGGGVASPNLAGSDISLSASALFVGTKSFNASVSAPWITGNHVSAGMKLWHKTRDNVLLDFEETTKFIRLDGGTYIGIPGRFKAFVGYYNLSSDRDGITLTEDNQDDILSTGILLGYDNRDSWIVPHSGWDSELLIFYVGGDANSWVLQVDGTRYQPIRDQHTIATGPLLSLQSGSVGTEVPQYFQYFLGGANSVRGYNLKELGKELYGKNQLLYTIEYRYLMMKVKPITVIGWSFGFGLELAGFADIGTAWSRGGDFNLDRTRIGYGGGIRLLLPSVEMVRFDFGLSRDGDLVFNFGVGSIFKARQQKVR